MRFVKALIHSPRASCRRATLAVRLAVARVELAHLRHCISHELDMHIVTSASLAGQAVELQREIAALEQQVKAGAVS